MCLWWSKMDTCCRGSVRDDRVEPKKHMLDSYPNLQALYRADDDNTEVLYLKNATATISSFTEEPKVIKF